jgi:hypothetical protein
MTRFEKRMLWALGLLIIVLSWLEASAPQPIDWRPSFSRDHRKPFGAQLVHESLRDLFPEVRSTTEPLAARAARRISNEPIADAPLNHVFVNSSLRWEREEARDLLALVELGDNAFIAAEQFVGNLADTLHVATEHKYPLGDGTSDIRFIGDDRIAPGVFRYARYFPGAYFTRFDTARTRVLAVDGSANPVLLEMVWGDGRIVLCSAPLAFTNYYLLKGVNATFLSGALSVLPPAPVLWDEHYKPGRTENTSPLRFLLGQPALRWAWAITFTLLLLYIFVFTRRQQRAIPVVQPLRNATRDLAHTIGRLYWHRGDHADLARKMITYFKEEIRSRTYLRTFAYDEPTIAHLAAKTGHDKDSITQRLALLRRYEQRVHMSEQELLELSRALHDFRQLIP